MAATCDSQSPTESAVVRLLVVDDHALVREVRNVSCSFHEGVLSLRGEAGTRMTASYSLGRAVRLPRSWGKSSAEESWPVGEPRKRRSSLPKRTRMTRASSRLTPASK